MILKVFLIFTFLLSTQVYAFVFPKNQSFVSGCRIYNQRLEKIRDLPGNFCLFFPDGRLITASKTAIRMMNPKLEVMWEVSGRVHHQMNFSNDKMRILALLSENHKTDKGILRIDKLAIISLAGKVISEVNASELIKDQVRLERYELPEVNKRQSGADIEETHFNSIYEIPKNKSKLAFLKEGNIIVNGLYNATCVLTPDLKKILDCRRFPMAIDHRIHDVQITPEGNYFFFNNQVIKSDIVPASEVQEVNPVNMKVTYRFQGSPAGIFYSPTHGKIQKLDDQHIVINHQYTGIYIVEKKSGKIVDSYPYIGKFEVSPLTEPVRMEDVNSFLAAWK
jgi:hypothetical protein